MFTNADTAEEICGEIGRRISMNRRSMGFSQAELAARAAVSKRSIERLESGTANPRLDVLVRVCLAMGIANRFEQLLPALELGPLALARGERLPQRIRKRTKKNARSRWQEDK